MFRTIATGVFSLLLLSLSQAARATTLTSCGSACDGDLFALIYNLDSNNGTTSIYDVTLLMDASGNNLGTTLHPVHIDAVAVELNHVTVQTVLDFAPGGAANWTGVGGGISAAGCDGKGSFICAKTTTAYALAPNASTATTPYEWTWDVEVADSTKGGAASVFAGGHGVKIHYTDVKGHLVSQDFTFTYAPPPSEHLSPVPEPVSATLVGTGLLSLCCFFVRRRATR